ncbi:MAG TPA: carboxypeptidase-like regulatory domain-containing protein, partial [Gemmatimonadaceae bacterium]|nr:carboxypeptidase-like regulatory domain-containing protein [Gemmatimonadaceae bacterium]
MRSSTHTGKHGGISHFRRRRSAALRAGPWVLAFAPLCASALHAQAVRATIRSVVDHQPLQGATISVVDEHDSTIRVAISGEAGEFSAAMPRAGSYSLDVRRKGYIEQKTPAKQVAVGDTARFDILMIEDSPGLLARARDAEFLYIMDWRHEWEGWRTDLFNVRQSLARALAKLPAPPVTLRPAGRGDRTQVIRYDIDQHELQAHVILSKNPAYGLVPMWVTPTDTEPADEALGIDNPLPPEYRDTVRARRLALLALLDSAAYALPDNQWVAGQRVRMYVDQQDTPAAIRATAQCQAVAWWCMMLRGYALYMAHDANAATASFESALRAMPPDTLCAWTDVGMLLPYTARTAYAKMSCAERGAVNARLWWLADPLYLVPGNDRQTAQLARRVLVALDAGNDVDEREDMRDDYTGPAEREMVLRYGWPTTMVWWPPPRVFQVELPPGTPASMRPPPMTL